MKIGDKVRFKAVGGNYAQVWGLTGVVEGERAHRPGCWTVILDNRPAGFPIDRVWAYDVDLDVIESTSVEDKAVHIFLMIMNGETDRANEWLDMLSRDDAWWIKEKAEELMSCAAGVVEQKEG